MIHPADGTAFESRRTSLQLWFFALRMLAEQIPGEQVLGIRRGRLAGERRRFRELLRVHRVETLAIARERGIVPDVLRARLVREAGERGRGHGDPHERTDAASDAGHGDHASAQARRRLW